MQRLQLQFSDLAAISFVVVVWGFNFVVMKAGLAHLTPFQMGLGRYLFAFLPLALMVPPPSVRIRWVISCSGLVAVCRVKAPSKSV